MRIIKDLMKANYGQPFFVCADKSKPCSFWVCGDQKPIAKPEYHHGSCASYGCPQENSCKYFEWVPEKKTMVHFIAQASWNQKLPTTNSKYLSKDFINGFNKSLMKI